MPVAITSLPESSAPGSQSPLTTDPTVLALCLMSEGSSTDAAALFESTPMMLVRRPVWKAASTPTSDKRRPEPPAPAVAEGGLIASAREAAIEVEAPTSPSSDLALMLARALVATLASTTTGPTSISVVMVVKALSESITKQLTVKLPSLGIHTIEGDIDRLPSGELSLVVPERGRDVKTKVIGRSPSSTHCTAVNLISVVSATAGASYSAVIAPPNGARFIVTLRPVVAVRP